MTLYSEILLIGVPNLKCRLIDRDEVILGNPCHPRISYNIVLTKSAEPLMLERILKSRPFNRPNTLISECHFSFTHEKYL